MLFAFLQQQWLHERASVLHFMYIACIVEFFVSGVSHEEAE
jgi:hypothetical protein